MKLNWNFACMKFVTESKWVDENRRWNEWILQSIASILGICEKLLAVDKIYNLWLLFDWILQEGGFKQI